MIKRYYSDINKVFQKGKVLVLYGPRRVGKTTLVKEWIEKSSKKAKFVTGDNLAVQEIVGSQDIERLLEYTDGYDLLVIDEAQRIPNIGWSLKLLIDTKPELDIIVTGSSSFELAGQVGEPLTGRKRTARLFPVSQLELSGDLNTYELKDSLSNILVYGSYPEIYTYKSNKKKIDELNEVVNSYLLKDILELDKVKGSKVLFDLLRLLAFQVGSEVSQTELASQLGIDYKTVGRYLDLFEKSFILYQLRGYSRNLRKEVNKMSKYYFYDNGVRNAIIQNFNPVEKRNDIGQLWENFLVIERLKKQEYKKLYTNNYFWRIWQGKEIDWIEEKEGKLFGYEFKYSDKRKATAPKLFLDTYDNSSWELVNNENYLEFVI